MKRLTAILLALVMAFSFAFACAEEETDDPESKIVLKTITLDASVESLTDTPEYSVSF